MAADGSVAACTTVAPGFVFWKRHTSGKDGNPTLSSSDQNSSPPVLVILLTWLFCKPSAVSRYASLYTARGYDVLQVSSQLSTFVWPPKSKRFAEDIVQVLKSHFSGYADIIVHAFSIGAYNYTTCKMVADEKPECKPYFLDKIRAVIFDSLTLGSLDHMVHGIATGMSQSALVQTATKWLAGTYFYLTHSATVETFNQGVEVFKSRPLPVPTLIFSSKNDPMCDVTVLKDMVVDWEVKATFPLTCKVWERSRHCGHLFYHGQEYEQILNDFLAALQSQSLQDDKKKTWKTLSKL